MVFVNEEDMMPYHLKLEVSAGALSSIYFVLFELIALGLTDSSIAGFVCAQYYKRVYSGHVMRVRSIDIPGITTNMLDSWTIPSNALALMWKLLILGAIFYIDLAIGSAQWQDETHDFRSGSFFFKGSEEEKTVDLKAREPFSLKRYRTNSSLSLFSREHVRRCRQVDTQNFRATFYRVAINHTGKTVRNAGSKFVFNDKSVVCMSPEHVTMPSIVAEVRGCSWLMKNDCDNSTHKYHKGALTTPRIFTLMSAMMLTGNHTFKFFQMNSTQVSMFWPEYHGANVSCAEMLIGSPSMKNRSHCVVMARKPNSNDTLVERWQYDSKRKEMYQQYAGPVFKGHVDIGMERMGLLLRYPEQNLNWETYSSVVVADLAEYEQNSLQMVIKGKKRTVTNVSMLSIGVAGFLLVVVFIVRIVVYFTIDGDERPRFNCIDGLSSIMREEYIPSGKSDRQGRTAFLGNWQDSANIMHFGPLCAADVNEAMTSSFTIAKEAKRIVPF